MEKRATVVDSIRQADKNLLLIDTGDILSTNINPRRHTFITKAYKYLNYDIWSAGDQDFVEGKKFFFESLMPQFKHILNTNFEIEGKQFGETNIIKQIENITKYCGGCCWSLFGIVYLY